MSVTVQITKTLRIDSTTYSENRSITAKKSVRHSESVAAAKAGTITSGTATLSSGHGITTGQIVSAFWTTGGAAKCRRNVTVGTVSGTSVPLTGGTGDTLPSGGAAIVLQVETIVEMRFDADDVQAVFASCSGPFVAWFSDDANTELGQFSAPNAGQAKEWNVQEGVNSPLTAASVITKLHFAHGDSTLARSVEVGVALN